MLRSVTISLALHLIWLFEVADRQSSAPNETSKVVVSLISSVEYGKIVAKAEAPQDLSAPHPEQPFSPDLKTEHAVSRNVSASRHASNASKIEESKDLSAAAAAPSTSEAGQEVVLGTDAATRTLSRANEEALDTRGRIDKGRGAGRSESGPDAGPIDRNTMLTAKDLARVHSEISAHIEKCMPSDFFKQTKKLAKVTARWRLRRDGSIEGVPYVVGPVIDTARRIAGLKTIEAIRRCQPFPLSSDDYDIWKSITWDFFVHVELE